MKLSQNRSPLARGAGRSGNGGTSAPGRAPWAVGAWAFSVRCTIAGQRWRIRIALPQKMSRKKVLRRGKEYKIMGMLFKIWTVAVTPTKELDQCQQEK